MFLIELSQKRVHLNFETKSERYDVLTFHCELHNNDELFVHWRMTKFLVGMEIRIFQKGDFSLWMFAAN